MPDTALSLSSRHLGELRRLIALHLPEEEVWAYGSRTAGSAHETSDLDLVVRHPADLEEPQSAAFWDLKAALSESNLPFLIELSDWARLPTAFRHNIAKQQIAIYSPEDRPGFVDSKRLEEGARVNESEKPHGE